MKSETNFKNQPILLPLESFALVRAGRTRQSWEARNAEPRWVGQVRGMRVDMDDPTLACLSAQLIVEHNVQPGRPEMWDCGYDAEGNIYKTQGKQDFLLQHKRWVDERGNLHNDSDAAFVSGKYKFYYLHGVTIDNPEWITTPVEKIDSGSILEIRNVDLRREMIRRKGLEQFLGQLFHRVIDKRGDYELLQVVLGERTDQFGTYLKMLNPSIGVWHMEGVPNNIRTVDEALLWRNNGWFVDADKLT